MPLSPELAKLVRDKIVESYKAAGDWGPGLYRGGALLEGAEHKAVYGGARRRGAKRSQSVKPRGKSRRARARKGGVLLEGAEHEAVYGGARGRGDCCADGSCHACRAEDAADRIESVISDIAEAVMPGNPAVHAYLRENLYGGKRSGAKKGLLADLLKGVDLRVQAQ